MVCFTLKESINACKVMQIHLEKHFLGNKAYSSVKILSMGSVRVKRENSVSPAYTHTAHKRFSFRRLYCPEGMNHE